MEPRKLTVAVVDDNRSAAAITPEQLGSRDFACFDAYDGRGAVELAATHALDVLILDVELPDMDGGEVLRRIEELGLRVPTILVAGEGEEAPKGWASSPLARAVVQKPFTAGELRGKVAEVLGVALP